MPTLTLTFAYDHSRDPMNPGDLAYRIAQQYGLAVMPQVDIDQTSINITHPQAAEAQRSTIQAIIDAYVLDPDWPGGDDNAAVLAYRARKALIDNDDFLAVVTPTNAQVLAQVQRLTRETSAVIRLLLGFLDTTDGT
jgi:hypothetical protein